jgi:hypothetical protein
LERVLDLEEFLGRLDEEGAEWAFAMASQAGAPFPVAALADARV